MWPLDKLCRQAILVDHASDVVAPLDAEVVQVGDIIYRALTLHLRRLPGHAPDEHGQYRYTGRYIVAT